MVEYLKGDVVFLKINDIETLGIVISLNDPLIDILLADSISNYRVYLDQLRPAGENVFDLIKSKPSIA